MKVETIFKLKPHTTPEIRTELVPIKEILRVRLSEILPLGTLLELRQIGQ